jgi:hypothetical protein
LRKHNRITTFDTLHIPILNICTRFTDVAAGTDGMVVLLVAATHLNNSQSIEEKSSDHVIWEF